MCLYKDHAYRNTIRDSKLPLFAVRAAGGFWLTHLDHGHHNKIDCYYNDRPGSVGGNAITRRLDMSNLVLC